MVSSYDDSVNAGGSRRSSPSVTGTRSEDTRSSKDHGDGPPAAEPAVDDDTLSQLSKSGVITGAPTTRHRGRRDATRIDRGSSLPMFRKLEKDVKHWKNAYDEMIIEKNALQGKLEAEKVAMANELVALKAQLAQASQND